MGFQQAWDGFNRFRDAAKSGEGVEGGVARAICDAYAGQPDVVNAATGATNPAFGAVLREGCKPYWEGPDGYTPPTEPTEGVPFEGGQCDGVQYLVAFSWEECGVQKANTVGPVLGPISFNGIESIREDDGDCGGETMQRWRWSASPKFGEVAQVFTNVSGSIDAVVSRVDGLPDDCGDPPPELTPSQPGAPPPGSGFGEPRDVGGPGSPFVVTPRLPELGPDGPYLPVDTPVGTEPYDPTNPGARPKPEAPAIGEPIDVEGSGGVDTDPGEEDEKPVLLGYRYEVRDSAPQFQSVIPGTNPRIYSRVVGSVQLILRGENGTFYSDNLQITSQEGSIVKQHPTLQVVGCVYNVLPSLEGLTLYEIRGKDDGG